MSDVKDDNSELTSEEKKELAESDRRFEQWLERWQELRKKAPWEIDVDVTTTSAPDFRYASADLDTKIRVTLHPTKLDDPSVSYGKPIVLLDDIVDLDAPLDDLQDAVRLAANLAPLSLDADWYRHGLRYITYRFLTQFESLMGMNEALGLATTTSSLFIDGPNAFWYEISLLLSDEEGTYTIARDENASLFNLRQFLNFWFNLGIKGNHRRPTRDQVTPLLTSFLSIPPKISSIEVSRLKSSERDSDERHNNEIDYFLFIDDAYRSWEYFQDVLTTSYRPEATRITAPTLQIPQGYSFKDIGIRTADPWPQAVDIFLPNIKKPKTYTFQDFSAVDQRTGKPNLIWLHFMRTIDQPDSYEGTKLVFNDPPDYTEQAHHRAKWIKRQIKMMLCRFFGTQEDPFYKYRKSEGEGDFGWILKIQIVRTY